MLIFRVSFRVSTSSLAEIEVEDSLSSKFRVAEHWVISVSVVLLFSLAERNFFLFPFSVVSL